MVKRRLLSMQDEVPDGYFTAAELSESLSVGTNQLKRMLRKMNLKPLKLKIFTGDSLQRVDHYKL